MKIKPILLVLIIMVIKLPAFASMSDENTLLFEFSKNVICKEAKSELSSHKIALDCDSSDQQKKRFFGGSYLGKKPVNTIISDLKKNHRIVSITQNKSVYRVK